MIVLWIAGSIVQWKLFRAEEEEKYEDQFEDDEDESKCCGCF